MRYTVKDGQTMADVAIECFGAWEAMTEIARLNNASMTAELKAGIVLSLPDAVWNRTMEGWCRDNEVSPATARNEGGVRMKVFTEEFTEEFS
ncbi:LysM domain-containing protein [Palleniella muris]|uniref:LysM domain-containing protein n=1 Tax=Palleniella muris TaxID=3038145 RepID=A0AC61QSC2_9BACT|nr:LysM peptidoglycan-binding domain-containing protein [Palleniella muris]TGX82980.1 LysM domain-containing protein [Palleniella muris]